MGCRNIITKTVSNPLTEESSEFFVSPEERTTYIRTRLASEKRNNPLFKKAKYIYVFKSRESDHTFRLRGTNRRTRYYGISILTDDNRYYYNEYRTKHTVLSMLTASNMFRIFLDGYIIDNNTQITVDDKISHSGEPLLIFLMIVAKSAGIIIHKRNIEAMMNTLNRRLNSIVKPRNGGKKITMYHKQHLMNGLIERGWLDFVPQKIMSQMLDKDNQPLEKRNLMFYCAMGILYMFRADLHSKWNHNR